MKLASTSTSPSSSSLPTNVGTVSSRLTPISAGRAFNIEQLQASSTIQPQESPLSISRDEERFFSELFPSPAELRQSSSFNRTGQLQSGVAKGQFVDARV